MRSRLVALFAVSAFGLTSLGASAGPAPEDPPLSSPNVELVATVPTGTGVGGKFAGGFYYQTTARAGSFTTGGVGTGGLNIFDVSNPELPVLSGALPLPIYQNEDVDLSARRKILLISNDRKKSVSQLTTSPIIGGTLFVIDIANPHAPLLKGTLDFPAEVGKTAQGVPLGGPGHVASCVLDCAYAYVGGSRDRSVWVVDLRKPEAPKIIGKIRTPAGNDNSEYNPGVVHDVNVDSSGYVWMTGSGGTAMYAPIKDPRKPRLLASVRAADNTRLNQLIHHGSLRLDKSTVLVGEESFDAACGGPDGADGPQDGSFQTWRIDLKAKRLAPLDTWDTEIVDDVSDLTTSMCSSHWFDVNRHKVVADAWYGQGVRFLDVSNPRKIRQVGFWIGPGSQAGQAQFVPGRPDLVYVSDYSRGLDVIRINGGGKGASTVARPSNAAAPRSNRAPTRFRPDDEFGYACPIAGV